MDFTKSKLPLVMVAVCCLFAASAGADSLQVAMDSFFVKLSSDLDRMSENPVMKKSRAASIDGLFLRELKHRQVVHLIIMTDAKGRSVTELVRMKDPNHAKTVVKDEKWFSEITKGAPEFYGMDRDTGRYYLSWSKPVLSASKKAKHPLLGVVMMKIDLWDCFQMISHTGETPFLIRLNKKTLYTHNWKNDIVYEEVPLSVPGAPSVMLRRQKSAAAPAPQVSQAQPASPDSAKIAALKADSIELAKKALEKQHKTKKIGVVLGIVALLLLVVFIFVLVAWIRQKLVIRRINRGL